MTVTDPPQEETLTSSMVSGRRDSRRALGDANKKRIERWSRNESNKKERLDTVIIIEKRKKKL